LALLENLFDYLWKNTLIPPEKILPTPKVANVILSCHALLFVVFD